MGSRCFPAGMWFFQNPLYAHGKLNNICFRFLGKENNNAWFKTWSSYSQNVILEGTHGFLFFSR
jgi:hypothetical protein